MVRLTPVGRYHRPGMDLSIVIPAYNEAALIESTVAAARRAADALVEPFEIIVVDDASTDATAPVAEAAGARVVSVRCRQIAATRNAGAREASGDWLAFLDADTTIEPATLRAARRAIDYGFVGGGATVAFTPPVTISARLAVKAWNFIARTKRWAAGSFLFCRREAFEALGGFDTRFYASEELGLSEALHRYAGRDRFAIVSPPVRTSSRKVRMYTWGEHFGPALRALVTRGRSLQRREGLELWYEGRRES